MSFEKLLMDNDSTLPFIEKAKMIIPNVQNHLWEELKRYFVVKESPEKIIIHHLNQNT